MDLAERPTNNNKWGGGGERQLEERGVVRNNWQARINMFSHPVERPSPVARVISNELPPFPSPIRSARPGHRIGRGSSLEGPRHGNLGGDREGAPGVTGRGALG